MSLDKEPPKNRKVFLQITTVMLHGTRHQPLNSTWKQAPIIIPLIQHR